MAERPQNFERASSPNLVPSKDDFNVYMKGMTVPETIKVSEDSNMNGFGAGNVGFQGTTSMTVPDRIVLDGSESEVEGRSGISRELQSNGVNLGSYMGGMVTPPRTLTVDDTTSRYHEETSVAGTVASPKGVKKGGRKNIDGKYAVNVGERLLPNSIQEAESDDISDLRLQSEIVRLNKRVAWLEKKEQDRQSNSSWRTTLVCLLTVINPIIIHWLFSKRRY